LGAYIAGLVPVGIYQHQAVQQYEFIIENRSSIFIPFTIFLVFSLYFFQ
jgi:hypothetical protein